jgi:O-acetyl-ADP-ribose deacetylase (regulator of RNase III)
MRVFVGDLTKVENVDAIVNAANGIGVMGAGLAGAIARSGGDLLREAVRKVVDENGSPFQVGEVYISDSGLLKRRGVKEIYHAVTMQFPGGRTSLDTVPKLLRSVLDTAMKNGLKSIAFGGLGCGIGGLDKSQVAMRMASIAEQYNGQIEITVVDQNPDFVEAFKKCVSVPIEES